MTVRDDTTFRDWVRDFVEGVPEDDRRDLARDPMGALMRRFGLQLRETAMPQVRGDGGWCDGMSFSQGNLVLYKPSPYSKREHFTVLHELAHFLVRRHKRFAVWVADRPDTKSYIEDLCNAVAAELLLPTTFVHGVLGGRKPTAAHFLTLVQTSEASREVCAIAIAPHLGCDGFAAVLSVNQGKVTFASRVAQTRPYPGRDDALPPGHPLHALTARRPLTAVGWWPDRDGQPEQFYVDAVAEGHFGYALFAVNDLWGATTLHVSDPLPNRPQGGPFRIACSCGHRGLTNQYPCIECGMPVCTNCGKCKCQRQTMHHVLCPGCNVRVPRGTISNGLCASCRMKVRRGAPR